jgi:hypothetical protein
MTIDDALEAIKGSGWCFIVWDERTGEIARVEAFDEPPSPEEHDDSLRRLSELKIPPISRFVPTIKADHQFLVAQANELKWCSARQSIFCKWSNMSVDELLTLLENAEYDWPATPRDAYIIAEHLWKVHRDELAASLERLEVLSRSARLDINAKRKFTTYLPALLRDEAAVARIWKREIPGRSTWEDTVALMEAFAYLGNPDQAIITDMLAIFDNALPFFRKHETMLKLGAMGSVAGARTAEVIRNRVYDSQADVINARDRVLDRITSGDEMWTRCPICSYGYVHGLRGCDAHCKRCLGIGQVRAGA